MQARIGVVALFVAIGAWWAPLETARPSQVSLYPGRVALDVLYYRPGDVNYAYVPANNVLANPGLKTADIQAIVDPGFGAFTGAQAAFQAAVDIWAHTIASPVPIRVTASFSPQAADVLASAGATVCNVGGVYWFAALYDKYHGAQTCAAMAGRGDELFVAFNSNFAAWDFGTSGVGVPGQANFMTAALHEIAHGLGVSGWITSDGTQGRFAQVVGIDAFSRSLGPIVIASNDLRDFPNPSAALHAALTGNNVVFTGSNAKAANNNAEPKLDTHDFGAFYAMSGTLNGWLEGSSYIHLDDPTFTATPNGLLTWGLGGNEVYTDPGPVLRGMMQDLGWTIRPLGTQVSCTFSVDKAHIDMDYGFAGDTLTLTTANGCAWTATASPQDPAVGGGWLSFRPVAPDRPSYDQTGVGTTVLTLKAQPNQSPTSRTETILIAGLTVTVTQAGFDPAGCTYALDNDAIRVSSSSTSTLIRVTTQTFCADTFVIDAPPGMLAASPNPWGYGLDLQIGATSSLLARKGTITVGGNPFTVTQGGLLDHMPPTDMDGDGRADLVSWNAGTFAWTASDAGSVPHSKNWGNVALGDVPMVGDIDGDGIGDLVVWRASTGMWYWLTSSTGYDYAAGGGVQWGNDGLGDRPMLADMDGDGAADPVVWRASTGTWYWLTSSSGYDYASAGGLQWGNAGLGDVPLLGDIDGDATADLVVWRASTGTWFWLTSSTGYNYGSAGVRQWGNFETYRDRPLLADLDGDGRKDFVIWRSGTWYVLKSSTEFSYVYSTAATWTGTSLGELPFAADFDGDGVADLAYWRPGPLCVDFGEPMCPADPTDTAGTWSWLSSQTGAAASKVFATKTAVK
jgi:FG-GAP-like repeat/Putative binding domain, N-terminal